MKPTFTFLTALLLASAACVALQAAREFRR
jgi:hypothetical protein